MISRNFLLYIILLCLGAPTLVWAASTEDIRAQIETQRDQLVSEAERFRNRPKELTLEEAPSVELEKEKPLAPLPEGPSFTIHKITVEGSSLFPKEDFQEYIQKYVNKPISFRELRELTDLITNHYRSRGYLTSRAFIPPQEMKDGKLMIRIVEGTIGQVIVEGNKWYNKHSYKKVFNFKPDDPFKVQALEKALNTINRDPDRKVKAYLIAGEKPATSDIVLKTKENFPLHAGYEFNNRGSKATHRARHEMFIRHNNLTGFGDVLDASLSLGEEAAFRGINSQYLFALSSSTQLTMQGSVSHSRLIGELKPFKVTGDSFTLIPGVTQKLWENKRITLSANASFEIKDSKIEVDHDKISFDRMRVLNIGPAIELKDSLGKTSLSTNLHLGIPGLLGGSKKHDPHASKENSGGQFAYYSASISRINKLPLNTYLILQTTAQMSPVTLNSLEQYRVGGASTVRGYPEGDSSGDSGFTVSSEVRMPAFIIPKGIRIPWTSKSLHDSFSFVIFLEGGKTYLQQRERAENEKVRTLLGTGFGVRFNYTRYFSALFDLGIPFGDNSTEKNRLQPNISARAEF